QSHDPRRVGEPKDAAEVRLDRIVEQHPADRDPSGDRLQPGRRRRAFRHSRGGRPRRGLEKDGLRPLHHRLVARRAIDDDGKSLMRRPARAQGGYNLVEVIIALAVFGIVAITIFTLFVMGRRNIYSGKQASQAVAIGTQVLEDLAPLNKKMIYNAAFGIADTDTGAAVTLPKISGQAAPTFANATERATHAHIVTSR